MIWVTLYKTPVKFSQNLRTEDESLADFSCMHHKRCHKRTSLHSILLARNCWGKNWAQNACRLQLFQNSIRGFKTPLLFFSTFCRFCGRGDIWVKTPSSCAFFKAFISDGWTLLHLKSRWRFATKNEKTSVNLSTNKSWYKNEKSHATFLSHVELSSHY